MKFVDKVNINGFSSKSLDISEILEIEGLLPTRKNSVVDLNIASSGMVLTLQGMNLCQEKIVLMDRYLGTLEGKKNKAWAEAALVLAPANGYKTGKDKEWFASADDDYIDNCNEISLAKAGKKFLENKASFFSGWHYAFKTFLGRDFFLEKLAGSGLGDYTINVRDDDLQETQEKNKKVQSSDVDWT